MPVSVLIPTYQGEQDVKALVPLLWAQDPRPDEILVTDSSSTDATAAVARELGCDVTVIPKASFNHAATRNDLVARARNDVVVLLSQDVRPVDNRCLATLVEPIEAGQASASYARQVAGPHAMPTERFLRHYNYPEGSELRSLDAVKDRGLQAFFFSNAAAAYRRADFSAVGGFPAGSIQNEDMILCARILRSGRRVAYQAEAVVEHTHNYTLRKQFRRYFDVGVATREAKGDLETGASVSKGSGYAVGQLRWFWSNGYRRWIPFGIAESGAKLVGYTLGRRHRLLPRAIKKRLSLHAYHWDQADPSRRGG